MKNQDYFWNNGYQVGNQVYTEIRILTWWNKQNYIWNRGYQVGKQI